MKKDFLLEVGCENLPSGYIDGALRQLEDTFARELGSLKIESDSIYVTGTPNRLVVHVRGLPGKQEGSVTTVTGPPISVAVGLRTPSDLESSRHLQTRPVGQAGQRHIDQEQEDGHLEYGQAGLANQAFAHQPNHHDREQ